MPDEFLLENPLAIFGDEDVVLGFRALEFKVYPIKEQQDFKAALDEILKNKIAACLVQENIYRKNLDEINNYKNLALPIFIPFSKGDGTQLLDGIIKDIRLKATGAF